MAKNRNIAKRAAFFLLYMDAEDQGGEAVESYDLGSFSQSRLRKGVACSPADLTSIRLKLSGGKPTDYLGGAHTWLIVSTRCANCLAPLISTHVQFLPIPVELPEGQVDKTRYQIINPLGSVDAIFIPNKPKHAVTLHELVLDTTKIPANVNMFRLTHNLIMLVVTSAVIQAIQDNDLIGFAATPLDTASNYIAQP